MKKLIPILFVFFSLNTLSAQDTPNAILSSGDIDKFIKTYQPMVKEFESLDEDLGEMNDPTTAETMHASAEANAIFKKYGWTENYFQKFTTIIMSTAYVSMTKQMGELDAEQKEMMKGVLDQLKATYASGVHEKDIKMVEERYEDIMTVLDEG